MTGADGKAAGSTRRTACRYTTRNSFAPGSDHAVRDAERRRPAFHGQPRAPTGVRSRGCRTTRRSVSTSPNRRSVPRVPAERMSRTGANGARRQRVYEAGQSTQLLGKVSSTASWQYRPWVNLKTSVGANTRTSKTTSCSRRVARLAPGASTLGATAHVRGVRRDAADRREDARLLRAGSRRRSRPPVPHGRRALGPEQRVRHEVPEASSIRRSARRGWSSDE